MAQINHVWQPAIWIVHDERPQKPNKLRQKCIHPESGRQIREKNPVDFTFYSKTDFDLEEELELATSIDYDNYITIEPFKSLLFIILEGQSHSHGLTNVVS